MKRCITCGKPVTDPGSENVVEREGKTYLVCCPLCEREFMRQPAHHVAIAESVYGNYRERDPIQVGAAAGSVSSELVHMLKSLHDGFNDILRQYRELYRHFDRIYEAGGFEGLRDSLAAHQNLMDELRYSMSIHRGACKIVVTVAESAATGRIPVDSPGTG